jgi:hypothetical protein
VPMRRKTTRLVGVSLSVFGLLVLLFAAGLVHQHRSATSEAKCAVCHLAQTPLTHAPPAAVLPGPTFLLPAPPARNELPAQEATFLQSPSRAPPA